MVESVHSSSSILQVPDGIQLTAVSLVPYSSCLRDRYHSPGLDVLEQFLYQRLCPSGIEDQGGERYPACFEQGDQRYEACPQGIDKGVGERPV